MKKIKLTWEASFDNEHKMLAFLNKISILHADGFGDGVVYKDIKEGGRYFDNTNEIDVTIEDIATNLCDTCTMGNNYVGFCMHKNTPHTECDHHVESEK